MANCANYKRGKLHHSPWHRDIGTSNQLNTCGHLPGSPDKPDYFYSLPASVRGLSGNGRSSSLRISNYVINVLEEFNNTHFNWGKLFHLLFSIPILQAFHSNSADGCLCD